jgi:hypothetical protein
MYKYFYTKDMLFMPVKAYQQLAPNSGRAMFGDASKGGKVQIFT